MNPAQIPHQRLHHQNISNHQFSAPVEIVSWLGALQGQDYPGAKWSLGLRLPHITETEVEQAILDKKIVRSWLMRGTLHLVAAEDLRWMLELLRERNIAGARSRHKQLKLDEDTFKSSQKVLHKILKKENALERKDIFEHFEKANITLEGNRGYHILWRAAHDGVICFGPMRGKQPTYVLLDEWVPEGEELDLDEALAELARRYFQARGPATLEDFAWWSSLTLTDARAGLEAIRSKLQEMVFDEQSYWMFDSGAPTSEKDAYLLSSFDEYLLGYTDRSTVLDHENAKKVQPGHSGTFRPTIVIDGQVAGTWKQTLKKNTVTIETSPFTKFTKAQSKAIAEAAKRYGQYLGKEAVLV
ncbi:MAG: winged helix DNA-binding domain-containing protein [Chloroflexi bacterium]|nr:MAG: winged helix DNA-binding domain-containing protein [Chloroflexota bacterium]MBL1196137.1 winged helix DNA-binding domain-containing protein [Chloroflexota bacterium]NOH13430.1 winged helix DNA-binding domain-containing protein [Chloroflexota bacterium]